MPGSSRGILLLAAAVIVGLFLLSKTENPSPVVVTTKPSKTTTTVPRSTSTTAPAATTTTAVRHDPSQVKVLVLNGVDKKKAIAGPGAKALVNAGFSQATGKDAANTVTKSIVYVVPGFEGDGTVVASLLGISSATVKALPTPLPPEVGNPGDAQIIVVLGPDAPVSTG
jgi:hypothetical protein